MNLILRVYHFLPEWVWITIAIFSFLYLCWHFSSQQYRKEEKEKKEKKQLKSAAQHS